MARQASAALTSIRRLLEPPSSGRSIADDVGIVRELRAAELAELTTSAGVEAVGLARAHAAALAGASTSAVLDAVRSIVGGGARSPAHELVRVALAASRCRRALEAIVGTSASLHAVRRATFVACFGPTLLHTRRVARVIRDHDVLITGETGTGKEHVAAAVLAAALGPVDGTVAPSSEINVAAIPEPLVESELFGHRKGSFTGAISDRTGAVRSADGGCLFLDEVGELPLQVQVKLLRVIETDRVQPVGSDKTFQVDVRFVAATHRDLPRLVREERFRHDLLQRLAGTVLHLPPLRERSEDVIAIGDRFLDGFDDDGMLAPEVRVARRWLRGAESERHDYPGNVRELKNVLRNILLGLPTGIERTEPIVDTRADAVPEAIRDGRAPIDEVEQWYIERTIRRTDGNLTAAARLLGVDRTTVARRARAMSGRPR